MTKPPPEGMKKHTPVDTDSVPSICRGLGQIEDELAHIQNALATAGYWRIKLKAERDQLVDGLLPKQQGRDAATRLAEAKKLANAEIDPHGRLLGDRIAEAEGKYAELNLTFEVLCRRQSGLQSVLKSHVAELSSSGLGQQQPQAA